MVSRSNHLLQPRMVSQSNHLDGKGYPLARGILRQAQDERP